MNVKKMTEKTGRIVNGKPETAEIGTLYVESCKGRILEIIEEHGSEFIEELVDNQILHHQASAAFKAKASKNDASVGLERLKWEASDSRQLFRQPYAKAAGELGIEGDEPEGADEIDVVRVNWAFKPGQSAAAVKKAEEEADKLRRFEAAVRHNLGLMRDFTGVEPTEEQTEKIREIVRKAVYGG